MAEQLGEAPPCFLPAGGFSRSRPQPRNRLRPKLEQPATERQAAPRWLGREFSEPLRERLVRRPEKLPRRSAAGPGLDLLPVRHRKHAAEQARLDEKKLKLKRAEKARS